MIAFGLDHDDLGKITLTVVGAEVSGRDIEADEITLTEKTTEYRTVMDDLFENITDDIKKLTISKEG